MHGKVTIAVYSLMVKQEPVNHTQWSVTDLIKVSCQFPVNKFLLEYKKMKIQTNNTKLMFLCYKFTTKEFKIY